MVVRWSRGRSDARTTPVTKTNASLPQCRHPHASPFPAHRAGHLSEKERADLWVVKRSGEALGHGAP